jgi:hypothetical protein
MATIANLSYVLTGNASQFLSTMDKATARLDKFAKGAVSTIQSLDSVSGVMHAVGGVGKTALAAIPGVGPVLSGIASVAETVTLPAVEAVTKAFKDGSKSVLEIDQSARKLGVSTESLSGLMLAAGGSTEAMEKGLFKLGEKLGAVQAGVERAESPFRKLGLNAEQLANMPLDSALGVISDRFNTLTTSGEKAYFAFTLFGKGGAELIPLLSRGSSNIDALKQKATALGLTFSNIDASRVREANIALGQMNMVWEGFQRQVAIGISPYLVALSESMGKFGIDARSTAEVVVESFKVVAVAAAMAKDALDYASSTTATIGQVNKGAIVSFFELYDSLTKSKEEAKLLSNVMRQDLEKSFDKMANMWNNAGGATEKVSKLFDDVAKRVREGRAKVDAVASPDANILKIGELLDKGAKFAEAHKSPWDTYVDKIKELNDLVNAGGISWELYNRSVMGAVDELEKASKITTPKSPEALQQGSKEAQSAIIKWQMGNEQGSRQDQVAQLLREAKEYQRRQAKAAEDTVDALRRIFTQGI